MRWTFGLFQLDPTLPRNFSLYLAFSWYFAPTSSNNNFPLVDHPAGSFEDILAIYLSDLLAWVFYLTLGFIGYSLEGELVYTYKKVLNIIALQTFYLRTRSDHSAYSASNHKSRINALPPLGIFFFRKTSACLQHHRLSTFSTFLGEEHTWTEHQFKEWRCGISHTPVVKIFHCKIKICVQYLSNPWKHWNL